MSAPLIHYRYDPAGHVAILGTTEVGRITPRNFDAKKRACWISFLPMPKNGTRMVSPELVKDIATARRELEESVRAFLEMAGRLSMAIPAEPTLEMCVAYLNAERLAPKLIKQWTEYLRKELGGPNECSFVVGLRAAIAVGAGITLEQTKRRHHNCFWGKGAHL